MFANILKTHIENIFLYLYPHLKAYMTQTNLFSSNLVVHCRIF